MTSPFERVVSGLEARDCRPRKGGDGYTARCPGHEDDRASLSISEGKDGKVLLRCFAGCEVADVAAALGLEMTDLFPERETTAKTKRNGSRGPAPWERPIRATFPYHDGDRKLLFEQVRFADATDDAGKCAPRHRDESGRWSWKSLTKHMNGTTIPLYRLPWLCEDVAAGRRVYVPEGEKDVDTLLSLGLAATTNYGGADGWKASYADELAGADVVVLPDNDAPGEKHADAIVRSLRGKAKAVRVLRLPGLPPKGDVSDWIAADGSPEVLEELADEVLSAAEQPEAPKAGSSDGDPGRDPSCAAQLIAIGREALLFADERGDGYAAFTDSSVRRVLKVRGSDFGGELSRRFAQSHDYQKAANSEAIASARNVLEALARHEGESHRLNTRFAQHEGAVWVDMVDSSWRAIKVTAAGWEIVETPPLLFRRYPHMRPLPEPIRGGDLSLLFEPFAMGEAERVLLTAHVVVSTIAGIPRPVLIVHGPQGAGKSTLEKRELAVLDPTGIDDLDLSGEPRELAQLLDQHGVSFFDNVVKVPDAAARMLCKASTGGGFEKRKLYTDEESVILTFKRAVLISAINIPTHAPDLLDRCLLIGLDRIPPERRRREEEMSRDFEAARPAILGGLLDALSGAMRVYPTLDLPELPRMADFAAWGAAVSEALGLTVGDLRGAAAFLAAYTENVGRQTEEVLESDPVARAVRDFANERGTWTGTASELLAALKPRNEEEMKSKDGGWPKRADGLSRRLEVLHSTLADAGVTLRRSREGKARTRTLTLSRAVEKGAEVSAVSVEAQPDLFPADAADDAFRPSTARVDFTYDGEGIARATWRPGTCPTVEDEEARVPGAVVRCGRPLAAGSSTCREHAGTFRPAVASAEVRP